MLELTELIGQGAFRACYKHPLTPGLCIKVFLPGKGSARQFKREIEVYKKVRPALQNFICFYQTELVETNLGPGLINELILDDDGQISQSICYYKGQKQIDDEIISGLNEFSECLLKNNLFFYDFNLLNFVIQKKNGRKLLRFIDLKSYHHYKPWTFLGLEKFIPALARLAMKQRLRKLYSRLGLKPEFF